MTPIGIKERPLFNIRLTKITKVYFSEYYEAHKDDMKVSFSEYTKMK